jgi:hypothetical protein
VERARDDVLRRSAAKAACIECDLIMKIHQQLAGAKLLPMRLEYSSLSEIIKRSE